MRRTIIHIDFNSYFASVEQQANPHLRGKPIGVTGGDRMTRTVLGAASVEAKKYGVKTGMQIWEAKRLCPQIILVKGDSDKYLEVTKRFLNILKDYSPARNASSPDNATSLRAGASVASGPYLEIFSIDEVFIELSPSVIARSDSDEAIFHGSRLPRSAKGGPRNDAVVMAQEIKSRIKSEIGEWMKCSIGISYNKLMAKLAGSLQKPDGLVVIPDQKTAITVLDKVELDEICGIGPRIKSRLNNMGIFSFAQLRRIPLEVLLASFKSYGQILYNMACGVDYAPIVPFYEKGEVKSVGHRHTIDHDTSDPSEIRQILLKLVELIARRLRTKNLVGKTVHCWYRQGATLVEVAPDHFEGDGMQATIPYTNDGMEIFKTAWKIFQKIWPARNASQSDAGGDGGKIRMIGVSVSNLKPAIPQNLSLLPDANKQETMLRIIDKINDKFGEFTLQRGILLGTGDIRRKPNPYLADRRFKL